MSSFISFFLQLKPVQYPVWTKQLQALSLPSIITLMQPTLVTQDILYQEMQLEDVTLMAH